MLINKSAPPLRVDLVQEFARRFTTNLEHFAIQQEDGTYLARSDSLTPIHFLHHLTGSWTIATYATYRFQSNWSCIDSDQEDGFARLLAVQGKLRGWGTDSLLERSRRGGHLWLFHSQYPTAMIRQVLRGIELACELEGCDLFPKGSGLGGCVRVPLGVHRKTGSVYPIWDHRQMRFLEDTTEAMRYIASLRELPGETEILLSEYAKTHEPGKRREKLRIQNTQPSRKVQEIRDLVRPDRISGITVHLGGMINCPFHPPDRRPSLHWNEEEKLYCDFHDMTGGDVIDLYGKLRGIERSQAIDELYRLVLRDRTYQPTGTPPDTAS